jgi:regulator of sirC expression with transglutaminase-like and TPR domain
MTSLRILLITTCALFSFPFQVGADDPKEQAKEKSVADIAESAKKSLAVIVFQGRNGKDQGLGTGFVVDADGLIATNLHVIGEARPISVLLGGKRHEVTAIHASDRKLDLALLRIDAKNLTPLPLADSNTLKPGQAIVVLGHPRGLKYSVVSGVLSGRRDVEGMSMLQLAIPIEPGNSGGPVLDHFGRVHGIVTMKSLVTPNLGFAVPSNALKPLLAKPNTIPMSRWLTIGTLDKSEWQPKMGARWRQRAGRIIADGLGTGFGGRTLCLWQKPLPKMPFEVAVTVKLENESGAAGLIFHADGGDKHYGFYPSGGRLRLTRFGGPDVLTWKILKEFESDHYHPGLWNTIKVRIENHKFLCYVNDHLEIESTDTDLTEGKVGLAKFRDTIAEFKHFTVAERIAGSKIPNDVVARINKTIDTISFTKPLPAKVIDALVPEGPAGLTVLRERARRLEEQAAQLRKLALAVHQQKTLAELAKTLQGPEEKIDLLAAALFIARLDNEELDVSAYQKEVARLAKEVAAALPKNADESVRLKALNKYLFQERGFHGSRVDYYTRANSYINEVMDDREGLPITLSVLYMELARHLKVKVVGVALPGHFIVRHEPENGEKQFIDVYDGGTFLSQQDAERILRTFTGKPSKKKAILNPLHLPGAAKKTIIVRMLHNLLNVAQDEQDRDGMLRYLDAIVAVAPDSADERWIRAVFRFQSGQREGALLDVDWLLDNSPPGVDLDRVRELKRLLAPK